MLSSNRLRQLLVPPVGRVFALALLFVIILILILIIIVIGRGRQRSKWCWYGHDIKTTFSKQEPESVVLEITAKKADSIGSFT